MFVITESAGEFLCAALERAQAPQEAALRLELDGGSLVSKLDEPRPGDTTFDHDGRKVLIMDERVCQLLEDSVLEVQPTPEGQKLVLIQ
jgi:hypothetical protein